MLNYRSYYNHKVNDLTECCIEENVNIGFNFYEQYTKNSKTGEAADEDMRYLPCQTRAVEGHVSLPSVMGDSQAQGTAVRRRSRESHRYEIPP